MKKALRHVVLLTVLAVLLANPPRKPLKKCQHCETQNEPDRTTCIGCGRSL